MFLNLLKEYIQYERQSHNMYKYYATFIRSKDFGRANGGGQDQTNNYYNHRNYYLGHSIPIHMKT